MHQAYFNGRDGLPRARQAQAGVPSYSGLPLSEDGLETGADDTDTEVVRAMASDVEVLRHRDIGELTAAEKHRLNAHVRDAAAAAPGAAHAAARALAPRRRSTPPGPCGPACAGWGSPPRSAWRRRGRKPRRVVLLIDVSGSMSSYADALLRLAHRMTQAGPVETFTIGTRLTHVTRALRGRDPERALVAAGETVPDWSGGTRLGETLRIFLERWGRRGLARGAVVVVFSDGWERGDTTLLAEQMAALRRVAHRVVWVNPHRGKSGYEPVQQGVVAALPFCHDFLAGHSLATYAELLEVVGRA